MRRRGTGAGTGTAGEIRADEIRAEIRREYPGWNPWQSSAGRWWAVRRAPGPPPGAPDGWARTVDGDTPDELRAALAAQEIHPPGGSAV